jgi:hypothetical protein
MPDMTTQLLPTLRFNQIPGLGLGDDFILPDYTGGSILNIPSTICRLLGAPELGAPPLREDILAPLENFNSETSGFRRVILVLMDALALHRLVRWMGDGTAPVWKSLSKEGILAPLTSIVPSTTSAALTSLWTGRSTTEHGIAGYELWLKEYGVVANMITHAPITFENDVGSLARAGFKPETFLTEPTLGTHLANHGVKSYALQHHSIARSGLSQMFFMDVDVQPFFTPSDLWINLRHLVEGKPDERQFIWIYWGEVDHFSHFYGPDDERSAAEFSAFSNAFEHFFLRRLPNEAYEDTLLILTADHGQITTSVNPDNELRNHPGLIHNLHILPTGENRLIYLYIRPGQREAVREYMDLVWPNQFHFIDPAVAVEAGLFGPGEMHPHLLDRLGDLIAITRNDSYLWWASKDNFLIGRHGGLSDDEMLVPFLAVRF